MSARFELRGSVAAGLDGLDIGPWESKPEPQTGPLTFGSANSDDDQPPRWRVDIDPGKFSQAHAAFDRSEAGMTLTEAHIGQVLARIDGTISRRESGQAGRNSGSDVPDAEAELLMDLGALRQQADTPAAGGPLTFGMSDGWAAMMASARRALQSIVRVATYPSWIETRIAGRLMARSAITWTGDAQNLGASLITPELIGIHKRSIGISLRTRNAWTRLLVTVVHGSARIAATTGPTGAALALPVAWSFARRALAEIKHLRSAYRAL